MPHTSGRSVQFLWSITSVLFVVTTLLGGFTLNSPVGAAESLLGDLQSCSNEGEEVQIDGIRNSKCFKCTCQNGFVNCDKESCPFIDDCYLLDPKTSDTCCRKCKGCIFRDISYASGSEWVDPEDPCKSYKCIASVITETNITCYSQCDNNQVALPRPGECCPTCDGCKINGQIVSEGQEVVASIDDRCLVCECTKNKLTCAKKACPILQCPISKQKQHPNECCPRCTQQRLFMPLSGKCIFSNNVYYDKTKFTPDRCTNCTCNNGTSICNRKTCPILECSADFQEQDGCCPRCISSEQRSECIYNGHTYLNNETWNIGPCRFCRCTVGTARCSEMRCPKVKCRTNEELSIPIGQCCSKCVESAGTCTIFGDPHFKTFDGKFFNFQGSCKYLLTADCHSNAFSIRLTNDGRGTKLSSWTKAITIKLVDVRINLGQNLRVKVNGTRVLMPYSQGSIVSIERQAEGILLKTQLGIIIEWDGNNFLQVTVPSFFKKKLCGLCGNYNGIARDDLTCRFGINHSDQAAWRFGNSWKVGGTKACSRKSEDITTQPSCKSRKSNIYCRPLRESEVFGHCDNRLNPINYIDSCKMDMCECQTGMCYCDSFAAYARECQRLGILLPDWRLATNCPAGVWKRTLYLSANKIRHYDELNFANTSLAQLSHQREQNLQQEQQKLHFQLNQLQSDFITKHVPKSLLSSKLTDFEQITLH